MVANESPLPFPAPRVGARRRLPARRSGMERRFESLPVPEERRRGAVRRVLADRRSWTERRRHATTETPGG